MSQTVQLQWRDRADNETLFKIYKSASSNLTTTDTLVATIEWDGASWGIVPENVNISNTSILSSNSGPSTQDEIFRIQFTEAETGEFYYGVASGNEIGMSDVVPSNTSLLVS